MTSRRPLSLSGAQMETVMAAARSLPSWQRCAFLRAIADQLEPLREPSDFAVSSAIRYALRCCDGGNDPDLAA
jgi:hypothetical protein